MAADQVPGLGRSIDRDTWMGWGLGREVEIGRPFIKAWVGGRGRGLSPESGVRKGLHIQTIFEGMVGVKEYKNASN